jgi:hypothetical protein
LLEDEAIQPRNPARPGRLSSALAALLALAAATARAEGNGVSLGGAARLHASFEADTRWDSQAALSVVSNGVPVDRPGDLVTHFRPGLKLKVPGASVHFAADGLLDYTFYAGLNAPTRSLSYLAAAAYAGLELNRGGPLSLILDDHFSRSDRVLNPAIGFGTLTTANSAEARVGFKPGEGTLRGGLTYAFAQEWYDPQGSTLPGCTAASCTGASYGAFDSTTHRFAFDARLLFQPKTAFTLDARTAIRSYRSAQANIQTVPTQVLGGIAGTVAPKVHLVLKGGYARSFARAGLEFQGFVGQVELRIAPFEKGEFKLGGLRAVEPVSDVYGWYADWRGYASMAMTLGGRFALSGSFNIDQIDFGNPEAGRSGIRSDTLLGWTAGLDYELNELVKLGVGEIYTRRFSNEGGAFSFLRSETYARISITY